MNESAKTCFTGGIQICAIQPTAVRSAAKPKRSPAFFHGESDERTIYVQFEPQHVIAPNMSEVRNHV